MAIKQLTTDPTEADLEAAIHNAINRAIPWLNPRDLRHQIRFSFTFGRSEIEIDGSTISKAEARSDILIDYKGTHLAVLELKRSGSGVEECDIKQGLSYARMLHPRPPLVILTDGNDLFILASHSGEEWKPADPSEEELAKLIKAAATIAEADCRDAIEILLGPTSTIWVPAMRAATSLTIQDLSGEWADPLRPFVSNFVLPRHTTESIYAQFKTDKRLIILQGPPLIGKSCVLRELCLKTEVRWIS